MKLRVAQRISIYIILSYFYKVMFYLRVKFNRPVKIRGEMVSPLISVVTKTRIMPRAISIDAQLQTLYRLRVFLRIFLDYFVDLESIGKQECIVAGWMVMEWVIKPALIGLGLSDFRERIERDQLQEWAIAAVKIMAEQKYYDVRLSYAQLDPNSRTFTYLNQFVLSKPGET